MRAWIGAILSLVVAIAIFLALAAVGALVYHLSGAGWHRAIVLVFLLGGAGLTIFALMTNRAGQMRSELFGFATERIYLVPPDERMTLNPTGVMAISGIVIAAIGVLVDALN